MYCAHHEQIGKGEYMGEGLGAGLCRLECPVMYSCRALKNRICKLNKSARAMDSLASQPTHHPGSGVEQ